MYVIDSGALTNLIFVVWYVVFFSIDLKKKKNFFLSNCGSWHGEQKVARHFGTEMWSFYQWHQLFFLQVLIALEKKIHNNNNKTFCMDFYISFRLRILDIRGEMKDFSIGIIMVI